MNKELEEAIQQYKELKRNKNIVETIEPKYFFEFADIMLNYIENSMSKETIKEKIKVLENSQKRVKNNNLIYSREDIFRFQIYILEELLEEK